MSDKPQHANTGSETGLLLFETYRNFLIKQHEQQYDGNTEANLHFFARHYDSMTLYQRLYGFIRPFFSIKENAIIPLRLLSTTERRNDLMEFFDDKKNWGAEDVKTGRSWKVEELRLKSNSDLHKLWYVLLKERNMLLTMEHECNEKMVVFPSPERIDKVEESMENLESVVRERNKAYYLLETGETGERPEEITNAFGLPHLHKKSEYPMPKHMNEEWLRKDSYRASGKDLREFLLKYKEKMYLEERKKKSRDFNHVCGLLKRFPNMDMQALKEQYPDVDIEKAKNSSKSRGHFVPQ